MNTTNPIIPLAESETVEFKTSFNEDVIATLVAFSNSKGGTLYIGITDNGDINKRNSNRQGNSSKLD